MLPWSGKNIYFIGFMAAGKSTIGSAFAAYLGWPFVDTDTCIEETAGKSVPEIFAEQGETAFRDMETRAIRNLAQRKNTVVALGGGAVLREENWQLLDASGITIWLNIPVSAVAQRVAASSHRPLLAGLADSERRKKIRTMMQTRKPYYQRARVKINCSGKQPVNKVVFDLFERLLYES